MDDREQTTVMQVSIPPHQELAIRACELHAHPLQVVNVGPLPFYITVEQPRGMIECRQLVSATGADLSAVTSSEGGTRAIKLWVVDSHFALAQITRLPAED